MSKKRVMRDFTIVEFSNVDKPAQTPATSVITKADSSMSLTKMKPKMGETEKEFVQRMMGGGQYNDMEESKRRDMFSRMYREGKPMMSKSLTEIDDTGHQHGVVISKSAGQIFFKMEKAGSEGMAEHSHSIVLDGENVVIGESNGHTHEPGHALIELVKSLSDDEDNTDGAETTKRIEHLEAIVSLTPFQRAYFDTLSKSEAELFLAKSSREREDIVKNAKEDDPVVYTTLKGKQVRKSAGDEVVDALKAADDALRELNKSRAENEALLYKARAEKELPHLPGDEATQTALLKAIDSIEDEERREKVLAMVHAHDASMAKNFKTVGLGANPDKSETATSSDEAHEQLCAIAKSMATKRSMTFEQAYVEATKENKELYRQALGVR